MSIIGILSDKSDNFRNIFEDACQTIWIFNIEGAVLIYCVIDQQSWLENFDCWVDSGSTLPSNRWLFNFLSRKQKKWRKSQRLKGKVKPDGQVYLSIWHFMIRSSVNRYSWEKTAFISESGAHHNCLITLTG